MKRRLLAAALVVGAVIASAALAVPASAADTISVAPGESIQAALSRAHAGDTILLHPGVYHDVVSVRKDDITIKGAGSGAHGTILRPPAELPGRCFQGASGICIVGDFRSGDLVKGVTVTGVRVEGFPAFGFVAFFARGTTFEDNAAVDAGEYGLAAFNSVGTVMRGNLATNSGEAGLYIGDSGSARATLVDNVVSGNAIGIFLRDSAHGWVYGNTAHDNCIGILVLDTGAPVHAGRYDIRGNRIRHNTELCPGGGDEPPTSGAGVAIVGGRGNTVKRNLIAANRASGPVPFHGGVVLITFEGAAPIGNLVSHNRLVANEPNVFSDGTGSGNVVVNNSCDPSC